jgi:hypothetical protein
MDFRSELHRLTGGRKPQASTVVHGCRYHRKSRAAPQGIVMTQGDARLPLVPLCTRDPAGERESRGPQPPLSRESGCGDGRHVCAAAA